MISLVGNDIENKRWEFTLSQNHFRPFFYIVMATSLFFLCSLRLLRALLLIAILTMLTHEHACLHRVLIFFCFREKKKHRKTRKTFFFLYSSDLPCASSNSYFPFLQQQQQYIIITQTSTASQIYIYTYINVLIAS